MGTPMITFKDFIKNLTKNLCFLVENLFHAKIGDLKKKIPEILWNSGFFFYRRTQTWRMTGFFLLKGDKSYWLREKFN